MSRGRECPATDCDERVKAGNKQGWCDTHTHDWVIAAEVPIEHRRAAGALRRMSVELKEQAYVIVREVYCELCRLPFAKAMTERIPCAGDDNLHLRGGPSGRKRRENGDDEVVFTTPVVPIRPANSNGNGVSRDLDPAQAVRSRA